VRYWFALLVCTERVSSVSRVNLAECNINCCVRRRCIGRPAWPAALPLWRLQRVWQGAVTDVSICSIASHQP